MTNGQNRKRWAISQQKKARALGAERRIEEISREAAAREWLNMFFGNMVARFLRGED